MALRPDEVREQMKVCTFYRTSPPLRGPLLKGGGKKHDLTIYDKSIIIAKVMRVKDIMQRNQYRISATATAEEAAQIMEQKMVGSLLVERNGKVTGIVTEGDLVRKVLAKGKDGNDSIRP